MVEAIKDTIQSVIGRLSGLESAGEDIDPDAWLKKVLTKKELKHIKVNYFRKGILGVNVDSSSWLYSFSLKKDKLLAAVIKESKLIKELRFNIGEIE